MLPVTRDEGVANELSKGAANKKPGEGARVHMGMEAAGIVWLDRIFSICHNCC